MWASAGLCASLARFVTWIATRTLRQFWTETLDETDRAV
ncbi:hypothetical protein SAMN05444004_102261 [Jannaschia faecimaris]|uniref:Uncharacterized protein n=1 Tax=Jannaschia faecimaris TaxID=1244108 RepID=A0A1H3LNN1_9RHOB|nr:hypothetical protein SAMN05444004_102261 [Jannaschia faecimaris]